MQTPSIQSITNLTASPTAGKVPDNAGSDVHFGQMLERQMTQREASKAPEATKQATPAPANKAPTSAPANTSTAPTSTATVDSEKPQETSVDAASAPTTANADAGKATTTAADATVKKDDKVVAIDDTKNTTGGADATLAASAAVMALVATAGSDASKNVAPAAAATTTTQPATDTTRVGNGTVSADSTDFTAKTGVRQTAENVSADLAGTSGKSSIDAFAAALQSAGKAVDGEAMASKASQLARANNSDITQITPQSQSAALNITPPTASHPGDILAPRVGNDAWNQTLGQRMVWMVAGAEQSASLTLNPPDLGPMQVVLHVSNGQADASFFAAQPEVRQALEAAMPKLREMLGEAGVSLGQTSVSAGQPQQQQASDQRASNSRSASSTSLDLNGATVSNGSNPIGRIISGNGLVDTFA